MYNNDNQDLACAVKMSAVLPGVFLIVTVKLVSEVL